MPWVYLAKRFAEAGAAQAEEHAKWFDSLSAEEQQSYINHHRELQKIKAAKWNLWDFLGLP